MVVQWLGLGAFSGFCQGLGFVPGERNKILKSVNEVKKKKKVKISKVQQKFYTPLFSIHTILKKNHKTWLSFSEFSTGNSLEKCPQNSVTSEMFISVIIMNSTN